MGRIVARVMACRINSAWLLSLIHIFHGQIFDEDYFEHLISEMQEIRASERRFYQKITDIYATAVDYSLDSQTTKDFFATVQNKMHYAVHHAVALEEGGILRASLVLPVRTAFIMRSVVGGKADHRVVINSQILERLNQIPHHIIHAPDHGLSLIHI